MTAFSDTVPAWYHDLRKQDWQSNGRRPNGLDAAHTRCLNALRALEDAVVRVAAERAARSTA